MKTKKSGIDWIGDIPATWKTKKIKYIFRIICGSTPESNNMDFWDGDIPWITPADMNDFGVISKGERNITKKGYNSCGTLLLPKESIVISTRAPIGKINITSSELCTNQGCKSLINPNVNTKYFYYLLNAGQEELIRQGRGTTFIELGTFELGNIFIAFPPPKEQQAIAAFLDARCGQADSIIAEMERQIETLKQYKTALITETVTKGLDKTAPMKDSGIEWIGKIPAHWDVSRLGFLFTFGKGLNITKEDLQDEGVPCVSYGEIHSKYGFEVNPEKNALRCVDKKYLGTDRKSLLKHGDFLFADTSEDLEGSGNFTYLNSSEKTFAGYHTIILRTRENINHRYIAYLFDSIPFRTQIRNKVCGVKVYSITQPILKSAKMILPPPKEQQAIAAFLDARCDQVDSIIADKRQSIETMRAYKKSLIYEYATGKKRIAEK
jgi:type I restriction enzyme S subunit